MQRYGFLLALSLASSLTQVAHREPPSDVFAAVDLTPQQIASIDAGQPVAKVLSWGGPSELYVFGAVHVDAPSERYLAMARDVNRLTSTNGYSGAGALGEPATVAEVSALTVEPDDVKALKNCREGSCDVQLPAASIAAFRDAAAGTDAATQVNRLARSTIVELLGAY